ncbi:MAG: polyhydroxyalkanoate depolymerase [Bdellovibrionales bacterium]
MFQYHLLDLQNVMLAPWAQSARTVGAWLRSPFSLLYHTEIGESLAALSTLFEQSTRSYKKPSFNFQQTRFRGDLVQICEKTVCREPFYQLLNFSRTSETPSTQEHIEQDPKVLVIPPMAGHFSTLLRGAIEPMLASHNVFVIDWVDAKMVPLTDGFFDLEDQIEAIIRCIETIGPEVHILTASQASVSSLCAVAILAAQNHIAQPLSLTLLGGPVDARNRAGLLAQPAQTHSLSWFRKTHSQLVPLYYPGALRMVYPGIMQLLDRMALTLDRHVTEQIKYYQYLVRGDEDAAENHKKFYEEFLCVMDVPEEFYIQLIERAYQRCDLPNGSFTWRGQKVDLAAIEKTAILTVEGELDDLSPAGQTRAALGLCTNLSDGKKRSHLEINVGHYGIFNGRKWRNNIQPMIHKFIREHSAP